MIMTRHLCFRKSIGRILALLLTVLLLPTPAYAETGSVTLDLSNPVEGSEATVTGTIELFRVATLDKDAMHYVLEEGLIAEGHEDDDLAVKLIEELNPNDLDSHNKEISDAIENGVVSGAVNLPFEEPNYRSTEITEEQAYFGDVEEGLYLVMHAFDSADENAAIMSPFLLSVPLKGELDVIARPKLGYLPPDSGGHENPGGDDPSHGSGSVDDELVVSKRVQSTRPEDVKRKFTFQVTLTNRPDLTGTFGDMEFLNGVATITLADGESATATGLMPETEYLVEELDYDDLMPSSVETKSEGTTVRTFTNGYYPDVETGKTDSDLEVRKKVESEREEDKTKLYEFTVRLWGSTLTGEYGDMTFTDGVATFALKDGESKKATGLPEGTKYMVEETDTLGLTPSHESSDDGTVVTFTNTYKPEEDTGTNDGEFQVKKIVNSSKEEDKTKSFGFKVTIWHDSETFMGTHRFGDMTFKDGVAEFTLADREVKVAKGLPEHTKYMVEETDTKGLVPTHEASEDGSKVTFTNTPKGETTPPTDSEGNKPGNDSTSTSSSPRTVTASTDSGGSTSVGQRVPKTGDQSIPFVAIAIVGIAAVIAGFVLSKRKK